MAFARDYYRAVEHVIDLGGGLRVTGVGQAACESPGLRPYLDKYLAGSRGEIPFGV
jgi:aromatic ring hydroxylase